MRIFPSSYGGEEAAPPRRRLREFNPCHEPAGSAKGGQFASRNSGNCEDSPNYGDEESLLAHPNLPLGEEPSFNRKPKPLYDASKDVDVQRLLTADPVDAEELGGGINPSFVVTLRDEDGEEFKAVFKPIDAEAWEAPAMDAEGNRVDEIDMDNERERFELANEREKDLGLREQWQEARDDFRGGVNTLAIQELVDEIVPGDRLVQDINSARMGTVALMVRLAEQRDQIVDPLTGKFVEGWEQVVTDTTNAVLAQLDEINQRSPIQTGIASLTPAYWMLGQDAGRGWGRIGPTYLDALSPLYGDGGFEAWKQAGHGNPDAIDDLSFNSWFAGKHGFMPGDEPAGNVVRESITNRDFSQAARDAAAYELDQMLGLNVTAPTVIREIPDLGSESTSEFGTGSAAGKGSLQKFVKPYDSTGPADTGEDNLWRLSTLDILIGNTDRHGGNLIELGNGEYRAIDNGLSFPSDHTELRSAFVGWTRGRKVPMSAALHKQLRDRMKRLDFNTWASKTGMDDAEREMFLSRVNWLTGLLDKPTPPTPADLASYGDFDFFD